MEEEENNKISEFNSTHFYEHITVIDNTTNLALCLVCKRSLPNDDPNNISTHVLSTNHKENLRILFNICIPNNPSKNYDNRLVNIITKSVFDLSIFLDHKTSYVHRYDNFVVCLICQDIISEVKSCNDSVKNDICNHVQSDQHLDKIKHNLCWVYKLEALSGFLMFHGTILFCSVCDRTYSREMNGALQNPLMHLQTEHPEEINNPPSYEEKDVNQTQQQEFSNSTLFKLSDESSEGEDEDWDVEVPKRLYESYLRRLNENKKDQLSTKIKIAQRNNNHPFITTIHCSKAFKFCVVCNDIPSDISDPIIDNDIRAHFLSDKHKANLELIRYHCIPDPFCDKSVDKYNEVVSVLNSNSGCVRQCDNYIICLICKNRISNITQSFETVKYDLVYHFNSKLHLSSMRENVWWFYYLQFSQVFIAFDNHISNCTDCATNLETIPYRVVQCVKDHLPEENLIFLGRDSPMIDVSANATKPIKLICSECKEGVDVYNDDRIFSMSLHLGRHRDPSEVNKCFETEVSEDAEFTCPLCQDKIVIFNKDLKLSLSLHKCVSSIEIAPNSSYGALNFDISMVFECLPPTFKEHCDSFILDRDEFGCKLCNCSFQLPSCVQDACKEVQNHISEFYHKEQYNASKITTPPINKRKTKVDPWDLFNDKRDSKTLSIMNSVIDENIEYIGEDECYYFCKICNCCFLSFGDRQDVMKIFASHFMCKNHIRKFNKYFQNKEWCKGYKIEEIPQNKIPEDFSCVDFMLEKEDGKKILSKLRTLPGFDLNSLFFLVHKNIFYCKLCKISISNDSINQAKKHLYSESHSMILVKNAAKYVKNLKERHLLNVANPIDNRFIVVLKTLAESYYRMNNPIITPHLILIDKNGKNFYCLICHLDIKFSQDGSTLLRHFRTTIHKKKTFNLNCDAYSRSNEPKSGFNQQQNQTFDKNKKEPRNVCDEISAKYKEIKNSVFKVSDLFEKLPKEYSVYQGFISMDDKNVTCSLCSFTVFPQNNFDADCKILQEHMAGRFHKQQYILRQGYSPDQKNVCDEFQINHNQISDHFAKPGKDLNGGAIEKVSSGSFPFKEKTNNARKDTKVWFGNTFLKPANLTWDFVDIEVSSFDDNVDYACPFCNDVVSITGKGVGADFEIHFKTAHFVEELLSKYDAVSVGQKLVRELFDCIPAFHKMSVKYITVNSCTLFCSLCKYFIITKAKDIFESAVQLHFHLSSKFHKHKENIILSLEPLNQPGTNLSVEIHIFANKKAPEEVKEILSEGKLFILETEYLEKQDFSESKGHKEQACGYSTVLNTDKDSLDMFGQELRSPREAFSNKRFSKVTSPEISVCEDPTFDHNTVLNNRGYHRPNGLDQSAASALNDKQKSCEIQIYDRDVSLINEESSINTGGRIDHVAVEETQLSTEVQNKNGIKTSSNVNRNESSISDLKSTNLKHKAMDWITVVLTEDLKIHLEFLESIEDQVICILCSSTVDQDNAKNHVTGLAHRRGFLAELKKKIESKMKFEARHLMFINNKLYCGSCRCYVTPWDDFHTLCQEVCSHLKNHANGFTQKRT